MRTTAQAHSNIALVKYWGKRNAGLNLPAVGSISMTLDSLYTRTSCEFDGSLEEDVFFLDGAPASPEQTARVTAFLDILREMATIDLPARVRSRNNFPTAAGLASSASGFAALALAGSRAAGLALAPGDLSILARRGSGSAARSIFGGFVEMRLPENSRETSPRETGTGDVAVQLHDENYWDLRMLILVVSPGEKETGSRAGMHRSAETAPFYDAWVSTAPEDLQEMRDALRQRDFEKVGELSEYSCLKMHGLILSSRPGIIYWREGTLAAMHAIRRLRKQGLPVYFTIDAGPQVKALCLPEHEEQVRVHLQQLPGVQEILTARPGPGTALREEQS